MNQSVLQLMNRLERRIGEMTQENVSIKKTISDLAGRKDDNDRAILKALRAGGNPSGGFSASVQGFDGSDHASIINVMSGGRQKSIGGGFGEYLRSMWVADSGRPGHIGWDGGDAYQHLEKGGWAPINKAVRGAVNKASLAEASGVTGGYTVAPQFYMNLLKLSVEDAAVRPRCTTIPMNSRSIFIPALDQSKTPATGTSAFLGGIKASWQPEAASITESDPIFRQLEMVARDLVFTCVASNQLLMDNAVALDSLLSTLFQEAMTWCYDYYIINGNGAGQPLGLLTSAAALTTTKVTSGVFGLADAADMWSKLLVQSQKSAVWLMHPSVMPNLIAMTNKSEAAGTTEGFLVWLNPAPHSGEGGPAAQPLPLGYFFGLPIIFTEKLPRLTAGSTGSVILADLSKQLVGDRLAIQIESSTLPLFQTNQTIWRIVARWDSTNWLNAPITLADGVYQMSSIVKFAA